MDERGLSYTLATEHYDFSLKAVGHAGDSIFEDGVAIP